MHFTITFLGTGTSQGIPVIGSDHPVCLSQDPRDKRLRSSIAISWKDACYVIDCGPDFRQQMLQNNITRLDGILFTHEHADHTAGLDDIRPFVFSQGKMPIYAHPRVLQELKNRFSYIFATENRYPGAPEVTCYSLEKQTPFFLKQQKVLPIDALHYKLQVFGFRFRNFAYLTDVKTISNTEKKKLKHLDVLVLNALRVAPHMSHLTLEEALDLIAELQPKKAYLTHISHHLGFHAAVEKTLPEHVFLAYDGLTITL